MGRGAGINSAINIVSYFLLFVAVASAIVAAVAATGLSNATPQYHCIAPCFCYYQMFFHCMSAGMIVDSLVVVVVVVVVECACGEGWEEGGHVETATFFRNAFIGTRNAASSVQRAQFQ